MIVRKADERAHALPADQEDVDGKAPKEFFTEGAEQLAEFEADAKAKVDELGKLLAEREEEFYAYQNSAADDYDDEEGDEEGGAPKKPAVDEIDYADDEDDDDEGGNKDEM